jgi:4-amino-4-deoxy-L-arabinose transferase-like glycosyltransferase
MQTTLDPGRGPAAGGVAGIVWILAGVKLLVHLATTGTFGYSYFVDELYYLACSEHLDWGYVDLPPLFPALTAAVRLPFGDSLFAVRLIPTISGAATFLLAGCLARELGGGRFAQGMAALACLTAPLYLAMNSIHTVNTLEPPLWVGCAWILARILRGASGRLWLLFGLLAGVGLLNKHSVACFGASVAAGLVLTSARRVFASRWIWLGAGVALLLFLPDLLWMIAHGFPHLELLANIRADGRDVALSPYQFLAQQVQVMHPVAAPLWISGLSWLLFGRAGRDFRPLGVAFLAFQALMIALNGRVYYVAPIYPILFSAGGVAWEAWAAGRLRVPSWSRPAYAGILAATGILLAPLTLPCLPPGTYVRYSRAIGLDQPRIEMHELGPLPQLFADRFGWKEMAQAVASIHRRLPPAERERTVIFGQNFGQAGAIDLFGPELGLPKAHSAHLTYFYWGPPDDAGQTWIVMDDERDVLARIFESVEYGGRVEHPFSMPYQRFDVWVCRGMKMPGRELRPRIKNFH